MNVFLLCLIVYLSVGVVLALLMSFLFKNEHLLNLNGIEFEAGDKESFEEFKECYKKHNFLTFVGLVGILPVFFAYDIVKLVLKLIKLVYNSCVKFVKTLFKKLFKGKK